MSFQQFVEELKKEINERNRKDAVDTLEEIFSKNINEISSYISH